jgi:hypothetical protein
MLATNSLDFRLGPSSVISVIIDGIRRNAIISLA